jgi:glycosyltransferase involved in cell wall biosynthesis
MLGALVAYNLKLPVVASWHTNIHEFAARRLMKTLSFVPPGLRGNRGIVGRNAGRFGSHANIATLSERTVLVLSLRYYRLGHVLLAPNLELVQLLQQGAGRPTFLMQRGVDTELFSPERRDRTGTELVIGYVGRLSPEKNVRALRDVEQALLAAGIENFRFVIVGDGHEREWLQANIQQWNSPVFSEATLWRGPMPTWTSSLSRPTPILMETSFWSHWRPAFPLL